MRVALLFLFGIGSIFSLPHPKPEPVIKKLLDKRRFKLPPSNDDGRDSAVQVEYFDQILDHNNPESETWRQKYFINKQHYEEGGPVFIMIGGEGKADIGWMSYGAWNEFAKSLGAYMIQLEHRFYGDSHPTENLSIENLQYLTSEQALADLANFIRAIKEKNDLESNKWISFGGSYPGSLSLWARLKYPELIDGAVSSSGPVFAKADFFEYLEVVDSDLEITDPKCSLAVQQGMQEAEAWYRNESYWPRLSELFNLCKTLDGNEMGDVYTLFSSMIGTFYGTAQYNDPTQKPNLESICKIMTDENRGPPIERLAEIVKDDLGPECINVDYEDNMELIQNENWEGNSEYVGYRQWVYQTCNEFGWYQTSNTPGHKYTDLFPLIAFTTQCRDAYGSKYTDEYIESRIEYINDYYGGLHPNVNNTISVHGSFDPWHAMGILQDLNPSSPAVLISGTSHCFDMYEDKPSDPSELTAARAKILHNIKKWCCSDERSSRK